MPSNRNTVLVGGCPLTETAIERAGLLMPPAWM